MPRAARAREPYLECKAPMRRQRVKVPGGGTLERCLGPGERYECADKKLGIVVPGRRGGTVVACAAPLYPEHANPRRRGEGALWVQGPKGVGTALPKSTIRTRLRDAKRGGKRVSADLNAAGLWIEEILRVPSDERVPAPTGAVYPHRVGSSKCDPEHPLWDGYPMTLAVAETRASVKLERRKNVTEADRRRATRAALQAEEPTLFPQWDQTALACAEAIETAFAKRRRGDSRQAKVAELRAQYRAQTGTRAGSAAGQALQSSSEGYANFQDLLEGHFGRKPGKRKR